MLKSEKPVVVEETFDVSRSTLWDALTEVEQMKKWFFDNIPDFKAEPGFETKFNVDTGERVFPHKWIITEVIPEKLIVYDWSYEGYEGRGLVSFELSDKNGNAHLKLTNEVVEDFPQDIPEFKRESCLGGWQYFINERLKDYLS